MKRGFIFIPLPPLTCWWKLGRLVTLCDQYLNMWVYNLLSCFKMGEAHLIRVNQSDIDM